GLAGATPGSADQRSPAKRTSAYGWLLTLPFSGELRMGKRFALRDRPRKADAIVALAGTRGNLDYLEAKIRTAVRLYQEGWAPRILFAGRLSAVVPDGPMPHISLS